MLTPNKEKFFKNMGKNRGKYNMVKHIMMDQLYRAVVGYNLAHRVMK